MIELYAFRHGQTEYNLEKRFQGQLDIPLTPLGIEESERVAEATRHLQFTLLVTSDLSRCLVMAKKVQLIHDAPLLVKPVWRERHVGVYEGQPYSTYDSPEPSKLAFQEPLIEEGESLDDLCSRGKKGLGEILKYTREDGHHVVGLFSHGALLATLQDTLFGWPYDP